MTGTDAQSGITGSDAKHNSSRRHASQSNDTNTATDQLRYLTRIFNVLQEGVLILDPDLNVVIASRGFLDRFALRWEAIANQPLQTISDGTFDIPALQQLLAEVIPTKVNVEQFELKHTFPIVGERHLMINAQPFTFYDSGPSHILLALHDITEVYRAYEERDRTQALLKLALYGTPIALFNQDRDLRYTWIHGNLVASIGRESVLGKDDSEILGDTEEIRQLNTVKREVMHKQVQREHVFHCLYKGEPNYAKLTIQPLIENNKVIGITCVAQDVTTEMIALKRETLLRDLSTALLSVTTLDDLVNEFEQLKTTLSAHLLSVGVTEADGKYVKIVNQHYIPSDVSMVFDRVPLDGLAPLTQAIRTGTAIWLHNTDEIRENFPLVDKKFRGTTGTQAMAVLPLKIEGDTFGALTISYPQSKQFTAPTRQFLNAIANQCAIAIDRIKLRNEMQDFAIAQQKKWFAREIHDAIGQALFSAQMLAEGLVADPAQNSDKRQSILEDLHQAILVAQSETRALLEEVRPDHQKQATVAELFSSLIAPLRNHDRTLISLNVPDELILPNEIAFALYRITQEALGNALKHSACTAIDICLERQDDYLGTIRLAIVDNGNGFTPNKQHHGLGLTSMRERAQTIGADLEITSHPRNGTRVVVTLTSVGSL